MRRPFAVRQRVLVEIIVEGEVQPNRHEGLGLGGIDAPALLADRIVRRHQRKIARRGLQIAPEVQRRCWSHRDQKTDKNQKSRCQFEGPVLAWR